MESVEFLENSFKEAINSNESCFLIQEILENNVVPEDILEKYLAYFSWENWFLISNDYLLSESFVTKNCAKLDTASISYYEFFNESFIEKHRLELDWAYLSEHYNFNSIDFILKNINFFVERRLRDNNKLNQKELEERGVYEALRLSR
jgi:hypothetical protein